jgi:hypothetical protein
VKVFAVNPSTTVARTYEGGAVRHQIAAPPRKSSAARLVRAACGHFATKQKFTCMTSS